MKIFLLVITLLGSVLCFSQRAVNYNFTINVTFTANENFGEYDDYLEKTDWSPIAPNAIFLRNGIDVKLNNIITTGINLGFDFHPDVDVLAIPYYVDAKFSIFQSDDDKFYVGGGIGKLLKLGKAFERGKYYKLGIGYHISSERNSSVIVSMDFHNKQIADFDNGRLNSLSFGIGIVFL
jgi:hypothetical protein